MKDFKVGDKIMGIANDILGVRIVDGKITEVIGEGERKRYILDDSKTIYAEQATEYDGWKLMQARIFFEEAFKLERDAQKLRDSAYNTIYSEGSK